MSALPPCDHDECPPTRCLHKKPFTPVPEGQWQDIETAPKDGTKVLLLWPSYAGNKAIIGKYDEREDHHWLPGNGSFFTIKSPPTHWMPLPQAPATFQASTKE